MVYLQGPVPPEPPPFPPIRLLKEGRVPQKEDYMSHMDDAMNYLTLPGVRRGKEIKHPAFAPGSREAIRKAEVEKLRRLARVLTVALAITSIFLVILLAIIGFGIWKHWNPTGLGVAQHDFPAMEGVLSPSALAWGEGCLRATLSPAFGKERAVKEIPRGDVNEEKGVWEAAKTPKALVAMLSCPVCGKTSVLSGHSIDKDGKVSPSVICPHACRFHDYVQLVGWAEMLEAVRQKEANNG